jgi:hypothetical protein
MNGERIHIYLQREMWNDKIGFYMYHIPHPSTDGSVEKEVLAITGFTTEPIDEGIMLPKALTLNNTEAQRLMDELWNCGLRPSEGSGSAGQLESVRYHLEDMRKLVFNG